MSVEEIIRIIKDDKSGKKNLLISYIKNLVTLPELQNGFPLLKEKSCEALLALINFNYELKAFLLTELLRIEAFVSTRFLSVYDEYRFKDFVESDFASKKDEESFKEIIETHFFAECEHIKLSTIFKNITFGTKKELISKLNSTIITKLYHPKILMSKKEFMKLIQICVEMRNIVVHHNFILSSNFYESMPTKPKRKEGTTSSEYFAKAVEVLNNLFAMPGFNKRLRTVCASYHNVLDVSYILN